MKAQNLPVLPHQIEDLKQARDRMEQALPGSFAALQRAVHHDAGAVQALHHRDDPARSEILAQSIRREQGLHADPQVRAQRIVEAFERFETERAKARPGDEREMVETRMRESVKTLEPDQEALARLRDDPRAHGVREHSTL